MAIWPFTKPKPAPQVILPELHPLITVILDLVRSNTDPWILYRDDKDDLYHDGQLYDKWLYLSRTASDRLFLKSIGNLCVGHKIKDKWVFDHITLTSSEQEVLTTAYDEIMRKRAIKIVEYRSPEKIKDLCS